MSTTQLSRRVLEAALEDYERRGALCEGRSLWAISRAARALLAVMQPASDEEVSVELGWQQRGNIIGNASPASAYRAAEARARRVAGWVDEPGEEGR